MKCIKKVNGKRCTRTAMNDSQYCELHNTKGARVAVRRKIEPNSVIREIIRFEVRENPLNKKVK